MTPRSCMRRLFRMRRKPPEVAEVITSLRRIDTLLEEMILKYERELAETQTLLHDAIQQKHAIWKVVKPSKQSNQGAFTRPRGPNNGCCVCSSTNTDVPLPLPRNIRANAAG